MAFVDGFEWFHGFSDEVVVYCIPPDDVTTEDVLIELQAVLGPLLAECALPPRDGLTSRIWVLVNG